MNPFAITALGLAFIAWGAIPLAWAERRHSAKLRARRERGTDRYHDELRALEAYNPKHRRLIMFGIGGALLSTGLSDLIKF